MTEGDCIRATNLAKVLIAEKVIRDCLFLDEDDAIEQKKAVDILYRLRERLQAQLEEGAGDGR